MDEETAGKIGRALGLLSRPHGKGPPRRVKHKEEGACRCADCRRMHGDWHKPKPKAAVPKNVARLVATPEKAAAAAAQLASLRKTFGRNGGRPRTVEHKDLGYCSCVDCRKKRGQYPKAQRRQKPV